MNLEVPIELFFRGLPLFLGKKVDKKMLLVLDKVQNVRNTKVVS